uniref:Uncharacterized protein n=1 Tax=Arundo donax TaxID=35708 RepID=A0A0A8Z0D1_ARUDO
MKSLMCSYARLGHMDYVRKVSNSQTLMSTRSSC